MKALEDSPFHGQRGDQVPNTWNVLLLWLALNKTPEAKRGPSAPAIWIIWTSATCAPPVPTTQGGCDIGCSSSPFQILYQSGLINLSWIY